MSVDTLVFWLFVVGWLVVVGLLALVALPRIVAEVGGIVRHIRRLIEESPLPLLLAKAEADVGRIDAAVGRLPALQARVEAALVTIRTTPIVPPGIAGLVRRVRFEIAEFRRTARS